MAPLQLFQRSIPVLTSCMSECYPSRSMARDPFRKRERCLGSNRHPLALCILHHRDSMTAGYSHSVSLCWGHSGSLKQDFYMSRMASISSCRMSPRMLQHGFAISSAALNTSRLIILLWGPLARCGTAEAELIIFDLQTITFTSKPKHKLI